MYKVTDYGKGYVRYTCSCGSRLKAGEEYCETCQELSEKLSKDTILVSDIDDYLNKIIQYCEMEVKDE